MATKKILRDEMPYLQQDSSPRELDHENDSRNASQSQRTKRAAINIFLAFHLLAIACWCVPIDSPLIPLCRNLVRPNQLGRAEPVPNGPSWGRLILWLLTLRESLPAAAIPVVWSVPFHAERSSTLVRI